ncbi:hypothetical protein HBI83_157060 [Parastagonospora nodorum]|nr:hypothetical protein HBI83_157060 [Parastagonospora nodorum]
MGDNNGLELSQAQKRRIDREDGRRRAPPSRMRACAECKRHKIKCESVPNKAKCAKCLRSGAECVPYNLNQRFLDEDASWKANANVKLSQLRSAVQLLLRHANLPDLEHAMAVSPGGSSRQTEDSSPANTFFEHAQSGMVVPPPMDMTREATAELEFLNDSGLATVPMKSLYDLTRLRTLSNSTTYGPNSASPSEDFISQNVVSLTEAEELFKRYMYDIRPYLWAGTLFPYDSLDAVRRSSTVLTAAVLTVAALHMSTGNDVLQRCYGVFVSLTYNTCLSRPCSLDDIRAQALGAFYISNLSWKLSGLAVRTGVELNLHQSYQKLMRGHEDHRDNVRLWYALYVCEHQYSIAYGRPPTIHEDAAIRNIEQFLDSPNATPGDVRLCAQVSMFKILTEAYHTYGSDPGHQLTEPELHQLRLFNLAIEEWRSSWQGRSTDAVGINSYPSKAVLMYYHFARVHLNSLALRALPPLTAMSWDTLSHERREAAIIATDSAISALTLILEETDLSRAMPVVPVFTHTMVAFCATFLLNLARVWNGTAQAHSPLSTAGGFDPGLGFNVGQSLALTRKTADFLMTVAENLNEKHLTNHIVQGINVVLERLEVASTPASAATFQVDGHAEMDFLQMHPGTAAETPFDMDNLEDFGFGCDDAFLKQVSSTNLDFWDAEPMY